MPEQEIELLSPTVSKVLDEYLAVLRADPDISDDDTDRLEELLRTGTVPKPDDLEVALFPPENGETP